MRVGQYADTADEHTVFGLIKSIINKQGSLADAIVTVDSKITDASSKIDPAVTDINAQVSSSTNTLTSTINTQVEGLSAKVDTTTNTLSSKIDDQTTGLSSQMSNVANKVESSTNALTSKIDAQSIGTYEDLVTAKTVFGMLHKIFDKLAALDAMAAQMSAMSNQMNTTFSDMQTSLNHISSQSDKIDSMSAMMIAMQTNIDRMSNQMANQTALSGSGYTYTMWTKRSYLEGYKLKLTDKTTSKSCYVAWDEDSEYWSGVLKAPLKADIWISLIDPSTGESQGELSITPTLTDGCAVIDLDSLIAGQISTVLGVNGPLATEVYKDPYFTKNTTILNAVVAGMVTNQEHLQDFVKSSTDIEIAATNLTVLWEDPTSVASIVAGAAGEAFLSNGTTGQTIANTKSILKNISQNTDLALKCNSISKFNSYLVNSTLTKKTKSVAVGSANSVSGNLICVSAASGSRGDRENVIEHSFQPYNDYDCYPDRYYLNQKIASYRSSIVCKKASTTYTVASAELVYGFNGYKATVDTSDYSVMYTTNCYYRRTGPSNWNYSRYYGFLAGNSANTCPSVGKFVDSISIAANSGTTADFSSVYLGGSSYDYGTLSVSTPTANSVITYIDLNE